MNRLWPLLAGLLLLACTSEPLLQPPPPIVEQEEEEKNEPEEEEETELEEEVKNESNVMGLNVHDLSDLGQLDAIVGHFQNLRVKWVRVEILATHSPDHWKAVVDKFHAAGIRVMGVLSHRSWHGPARDPDACGYEPTDFGERLVNEFIPAVDPYVQRLKSRVRVWEVWDEANHDPTWLCPGNYAHLLVAAQLRWPDIGALGTSTRSQGKGTEARDYLSTLYNNTDKVNGFRLTYGGPPWQKAMHHLYPDLERSWDRAFISHQGSLLREVQPQPLWFTEIGWPTHGINSGEAAQASGVEGAYAFGRQYAEKVFWSALYDCEGPFGLISDCENPNGTPRKAYWAFREIHGCEMGYLQASNGRWVVVAEGWGDNNKVLYANSDVVGDFDRFRVWGTLHGRVVLQSYHFVDAKVWGGQELRADYQSPKYGAAMVPKSAEFFVNFLGGNRLALRASNGRWVRADPNEGGRLSATAEEVGEWETFTLVCAPFQKL